MATTAPRNSQDRPSDAWYVIEDVAALSADPDLTAISKKPNFAPQRLTISNDTAASIDVVLVGEDQSATSADTYTISVPPNGTIVLCRPIKSIDESASGAVQVICEWWGGDSLEWNP